MQYAIELFFNEEMEQNLLHYAKRISEENLSTNWLEWKTRPHITLACFKDVDEEKCTALLKEFAQKHQSFPAYIGSVGMFTDTKTIFASPIMTSALYDIQRELHECMSDFDAHAYPWYLPGRWVPHCGLAMMSEDEPEAFYKACDLVLREFRKHSGTFSEIGLVKVSFPVEDICTVKLNP